MHFSLLQMPCHHNLQSQHCCMGPVHSKVLVHLPLVLRPSSYLPALQEAHIGSEAEAQCLAGDRKFFGHAEPSDLGAAFE